MRMLSTLILIASPYATAMSSSPVCMDGGSVFIARESATSVGTCFSRKLALARQVPARVLFALFREFTDFPWTYHLSPKPLFVSEESREPTLRRTRWAVCDALEGR